MSSIQGKIWKGTTWKKHCWESFGLQQLLLMPHQSRIRSELVLCLSLLLRSHGIEIHLLWSYGMNLYGTLFSTTIPFLEFSIEFQSNNLIYDKGYSKRQQVIYCLILFLREEGMVYRRICWKNNINERKSLQYSS